MDAVGELSAQPVSERDELDRMVRTLSGIVDVADAHDVEASRVVMSALWAHVQILMLAERFEAAYDVLANLQERRAVLATDAFEDAWVRGVDLAKVRLLYYTGRFEQVLTVADAYVREGSVADLDDLDRVSQALWYSRFAPVGLGLDVPSGDPIRERLLYASQAAVRTATAHGSRMVLWWSLAAKDGPAVLDVLSVLEDAFAEERDVDVELEVAGVLIEAALWFSSYLGAFLSPELLERAVHTSQLVVDRFQFVESDAGADTLAYAFWGQHRALTGLAGSDEAQLKDANEVGARLISMGMVAADMLRRLRADHQARDVNGRAYDINLAVLQAVALEAAGYHHDQAVALLDDTVARYEDDASAQIQECMTWARSMRDMVNEPDEDD